MIEWVWSIGGMILTGETGVLGEKHYTASMLDEWMSMEHWWNDTDRVNWSTGRKRLYSVGGRWMNEYGALVEWCWQGKLQYWEKNIIQEWYWQGKTVVFMKNSVPVSHCPPHISHGLSWDSSRAMFIRGPVTNQVSRGMAQFCIMSQSCRRISWPFSTHTLKK
jgi:hypothetical protein